MFPAPIRMILFKIQAGIEYLGSARWFEFILLLTNFILIHNY